MIRIRADVPGIPEAHFSSGKPGWKIVFGPVVTQLRKYMCSHLSQGIRGGMKEVNGLFRISIPGRCKFPTIETELI